MSKMWQRIKAKYSLYLESSFSAAAYSPKAPFVERLTMRQLCATNSLTVISVCDNFSDYELALGQTNSCARKSSWRKSTTFLVFLQNDCKNEVFVEPRLR